jgi:hypothetical protein
MPQQDIGPIDVIDEDLRSCASLRRVAERELAELRRRQADLAEMEASLVMTIALRWMVADRLLDERNALVTGADDIRLADVA